MPHGRSARVRASRARPTATIYLMFTQQARALRPAQSMSNVCATWSLVAAVALLSACGGGAPSASDAYPTQSLFDLLSDSGLQQIAVRTAPEQPPTRGVVSMQLTITDAATGAPQVGLDLKVVPWMPAMGHGTSVKPTIIETRPGTYELENLVLFMPGTWQIRTRWAEPSEHVTPTLSIR